jgi:hypothetical protein
MPAPARPCALCGEPTRAPDHAGHCTACTDLMRDLTAAPNPDADGKVTF